MDIISYGAAAKARKVAESKSKSYVKNLAPTVNDDINSGYNIGDTWKDTVTGTKYTLINNVTGAAVWDSKTVSADNIGYDNTTSGLTETSVQGAVDELGASTMKTTGDQTVDDVKTFTSSPIVPTPTTDLQAVNKEYADAIVGELSTDYYQGAYGINWDYATDTYIRTGAKGYTSIQSQMKRCVLNADGTVNYYLHPENSNFKENGDVAVLDGTDGNVMVEIPKFYVKLETIGNVDKISLSLTPEVGYSLHPAFIKAELEVDYRYYRAYEGYNSGGVLKSISGVTPTRSQTISTFRTQAMANGTGWHQTDWHLLNAVRLLCYVEFADFNVAKYIGSGNDTGSDYGITTGQSNAIGNGNSPSTNNNTWMSYRGIENFYADIWEFVDGVNIQNYEFFVNGDYRTFASDVFTVDYVSTGVSTVAMSQSYIKRCSITLDGGFIPTIVGGASTTYYSDGGWSATGNKVAIFGGAASDGAIAGPGALYVASASSLLLASLGGAVCF